MKKYEDFIEGLQQDIEVPGAVRDKFCETLEKLEVSSAQKQVKRHSIRRWVSAAAIAAIIVVGGTGFCMANPVLAAKIPIIGKVFEQLEQDVSFSGEFKEKAQILAEEPAGEEVAETVADEYKVEDQGIAITAAEVYCDGQSIFLTAELHKENGKFNSIPRYNVSSDAAEIQELYTAGGWSMDSNGVSGQLRNNTFQGRALDDNTFLGMIKIDLDTLQETDDVLNLNFSMIGYEDINETGEEPEGLICATHSYEGSWDLSIPFTVDTQGTHVIEVNQTMENGGGIAKVFVSPYQVIIDEIRPEISDTEEEVQQVPLDLAVFTQDGTSLQLNNTNLDDRLAFAVQGHDISQLQIYIADAPMFTTFTTCNREEAKASADLEITVDVK